MLSLIGGTTVHSGLDFAWGKRKRDYYPLNDERREKIRIELNDLQLIIIDEMSMISSDLLYMIHKRLCEIFVSDDPFAGKAILLVGDLMQLRPIFGRFIYDNPANRKFQPLHQVDPLWHACEVIVLSTNFRQGDSSYSAILNRARIGELTEADKEILNKRRVHPNKDKKIIDEAIHVFWTNEEVENLNMKKLNQLSTPLETIQAQIISTRGYKPPINDYGKIDDTPFKNVLKLKIGAKVMITFNINITDSIVNGTTGTIVDFVKSNGCIQSILILFDDKDAGFAQRCANKHISLENYPDATPIFKTSLEYIPTSKKSGSSHGCKVKVTQFALRLSWASTCHKVQGDTIPLGLNLVANGHENIPAAMQYVMMSRVSDIENLYISKNFDLDKVRCIKKSLQEKERLDGLFDQKVVKEYDLTFMNIRSLRANYQDLLCEPLVVNSKVLCLAETWIYPKEENSELNKLPSNKRATFSSFGRGKGCCLFYDKGQCYENVKNHSSESFQMIGGLLNNSIQVYVIYISKEASLESVVQILKEWMKSGPKLVIGDFNIEASQINVLSKFMISQGLKQIVKRPTHIAGGIIDHCYISSDMQNSVKIDYFFPYYTDHLAMCLTFPKNI